MSEVPSCEASDGTSFGVKQLLRQEAVELPGWSELAYRFRLIPP